ncbi:YhcH/YjgK/YiaL family protein [Paenibacillus jiagnxiensis]|uniref:YhcH/YjgK/YiaL family protein n=1 Tax=Paenibacillus jiagnxiensis TaxID=3228926 RepID=UPI0033AD9ED0
MILAVLDQAELFRHLHPGFDEAFAFIQQSSTRDLIPGKYKIDGDRVFAMVQEYVTKPESECGWESHREYIDIQYLVLGQEQMNSAPLDRLIDQSDYVTATDKISYRSALSPYSSLQVRAGQFTVFFPEDGHQACICSGTSEVVKKIVIKVKASAQCTYQAKNGE